MTRIDRRDAAAQGHEALAICRSGEYRSPRGSVSIAHLITRACDATLSIPPTKPLAPVARGSHATVFEVKNETTIAAILRAPAALGEPCALNFASAKNPGGGFLGGALAQEESLARSSALFACLEGDAMYAHHRARKDALYTSWAIFSPGVPVFRGDDGLLLEEPRLASFITCAAPNAGVLLAREPERADELDAALRERVARVLTIAAQQGARSLILGAWGCGVFKNDPARVAEHFEG